MDGGISGPCLDKDGMDLKLPAVAIVTLTPQLLSMVYPTTDHPYIFKVEVAKDGMTPTSFEMPVTLVEAAIPAVGIDSASGYKQPDGSIIINGNDQLVVHGDCKVTAAGTIQVSWSFVPQIDMSRVSFLAGETSDTSTSEALLINAGSGVFVAGSTYKLEFTCQDQAGEKSVAQFSLNVNAPPRGNPCSTCRLAGIDCAKDQASTGEAIFDTFR